MERFLFVVVLIMAPVISWACDAGYYLDADGKTCNECSPIEDAYYCPGDDTRHACPAVTDAMRAKYEELSGGKIYTLGKVWVDNQIKTPTNSGQCNFSLTITVPAGTYYTSGGYNAGLGLYGDTSYKLWFIAANGYYLSQYNYKSSNTWYNGVKACTNAPANAHYTGPGTPDDPVASGGKTDYNDCPWACDAGYYLDGGICKICDTGYYCPGDNARHYCSEMGNGAYDAPYYADETGLAACKKCPTLDGASYYWYYRADPSDPLAHVHVDKQPCRANWDVPMPHGRFNISCSYATNGYTGSGNVCQLHRTLSQRCDAGYYLDINNKQLVSSYNASNIFLRDYATFDKYIDQYCAPVPVGYYSLGDTWAATACPDGTSTHEPGATSADKCVSLCANGGKKLHAGDHEFNIWPNGTCTSPSIGIGLANGTCCVNLESGRGTGINVEWDGNIYHTVN